MCACMHVGDAAAVCIELDRIQQTRRTKGKEFQDDKSFGLMGTCLYNY